MKSKKNDNTSPTSSRRQGFQAQRYYVLLSLLLCATVALTWRMVDLHVFNHTFLKAQGDARIVRTSVVNTYRGMITDRHGEPLAISTPVDSVWAQPQVLLSSKRYPEIVPILELERDSFDQRLQEYQDRDFMYIKRRVTPDISAKIESLNIPGIYFQREYRRYYTGGEVFAHLLGFTNVDDKGQEGLELAFDKRLQSVAGRKRVLQDRLGRVIEDVESIQEADLGEDLYLSIDKNIQYLAYRELKAAVEHHQAESGSVVILDVKTGEVLAMVNQPSFNPNNVAAADAAGLRNRAATDVFEPGSTVKPFAIAAVLQSGTITMETLVDTNPGRMQVGGHTIRDVRNYGEMDVATVLQKSSNVGMIKLALQLPEDYIPSVLGRFGFGESTYSGFPGERIGSLPTIKRTSDLASLAYGYGLSVTALQLAQAYTILARKGNTIPVSFLALEPTKIPVGEPVMNSTDAEQILAVLESVTEAGVGNARMARVAGYRVGGKTGTARKVGDQGYIDDSYIASFAGIAPMSDPRIVVVVVIHDPKGDQYFGGQVSAPVFSRIVGGTLRFLNIQPDGLEDSRNVVKITRVAMRDDS